MAERIEKRITIYTDYDFDIFKEAFRYGAYNLVKGELTAELVARMFDSLAVVDGKIVTYNGDKKISHVDLPYSEEALKECEARGWKYEVTDYRW